MAEQNIVGVAMGCAARGRAVTFSSTFAAFFTRTFDHLRMAAVSQTSANFCGSHCGVSLLVCCFLNEFNVGNIFLIKFVMGLLYPWVSIVRCHVSVTLQYMPHLLKHLSLYFIPSVGSCNYAFANKQKSRLWGRREEVHVYTGKS